MNNKDLQDILSARTYPEKEEPITKEDVARMLASGMEPEWVERLVRANKIALRAEAHTPLDDSVRWSKVIRNDWREYAEV